MITSELRCGHHDNDASLRAVISSRQETVGNSVPASMSFSEHQSLFQNGQIRAWSCREWQSYHSMLSYLISWEDFRWALAKILISVTEVLDFSVRGMIPLMPS
jgi:hypothetical protein